jgi:hypothetical protein
MTISFKLCGAPLAKQPTFTLLGDHAFPFDATECEICGLFQIVYDWEAQEPHTLTTDSDAALAGLVLGLGAGVSGQRRKSDDRLLNRCA